MLQEFSYLMNMGVQHAGLGGIRWSGSAFSCTNWENGVKWILSGSLTPDEHGRAGQLNLDLVVFEPQLTKPRNGRWIVTYSYDEQASPSFIPSRITTELVRGAQRVMLDQYRILKLELGLDPLPTQSFNPDRFVSPTTVAFVVTNNHILTFANGQWEERMKPDDPRILKPLPAPILKPNTARKIYLAVVLLLFVPAFLIFRKVGTRKQETTNKT